MVADEKRSGRVVVSQMNGLVRFLVMLSSDKCLVVDHHVGTVPLLGLRSGSFGGVSENEWIDEMSIMSCTIDSLVSSHHVMIIGLDFFLVDLRPRDVAAPAHVSREACFCGRSICDVVNTGGMRGSESKRCFVNGGQDITQHSIRSSCDECHLCVSVYVRYALISMPTATSGRWRQGDARNERYRIQD